MFVKFWIQSSRGTKGSTVVYLPDGSSKDYIKEKLEEWCSGFTAWHVSENHVSYGFKKVKSSKKLIGAQYCRLRNRLELVAEELRNTIRKDPFTNNLGPERTLRDVEKASRRLLKIATNLNRKEKS